MDGLSNISDLLKKSLQVYKDRFWVILGFLAPSLATAVLPLTPVVPKLFITILSLAGIIVSVWFGVAFLFVVKDREQKIGIRESLTKGWHKILSYWWVSILMVLVVMGGLLLLVIPGIIFSIWFGLAVFVLISEDIKGMNALFRSKQLVEGYWWKVFWRLLVMGVLVALVSLGVRAFFSLFHSDALNLISSLITVLAAPIGTIYAFLIYEDLKKIKTGSAFDLPKQGTKIKYIIVAVLGFLLIPAILAGIAFTAARNVGGLARDTRREVDLRKTSTALELYYIDNNAYPASLGEIKNRLGEMPIDPKTKLSYTYILQTGGQNYLLCADFEQKEKQKEACIDSRGSRSPRGGSGAVNYLCKTDFDCADQNPCTDDRCAQGNCAHTNSVAGLSCGATIPGEAQTNFCDGTGNCVY